LGVVNVKESSKHTLTWHELEKFIQYLKKPGMKFVGRAALDEAIKRVSLGFDGAKDCLYFDDDGKLGPEVRCKYANCGFLIRFKVEENEQNERIYTCGIAKHWKHLESAHNQGKLKLMYL